MKLYRFSPINSEQELLEAIKHVHYECNKLCFASMGRYLPNAWNMAIFCHYDNEYEKLLTMRKKMTEVSDNRDQKYFRLHEPIVIAECNWIPETIYTHLYIRKPDPYRHHVGDVDFELGESDYKILKQHLLDGAIVSGARVFDRGDLDMIELHDPDSDALWYISIRQTS